MEEWYDVLYHNPMRWRNLYHEWGLLLSESKLLIPYSKRLFDHRLEGGMMTEMQFFSLVFE